MNETMITIIQCVLLIPAIATIGTFWYLVISTIINGTFPKKLTDKEIEDKTK